MTKRSTRVTTFEIRSLMLIAGVTLAMAGVTHAQSTAAPAADAEAAAAFTKADKNGDGKLSREEAASLPAIASNFDKFDTDKDGSISPAEFAKAMKM